MPLCSTLITDDPVTPEPEEPVVEEPVEEEPVFENCDDVRAAGKAPIREGDPGFRSKFDRDGDGVGCE